MLMLWGRLGRSDVTAGALVAVAYGIILLAIAAASPATPAHWERADPILLLVPRAAMPWLVPALAVAGAVAWRRVARPSRDEARRAALHAGAGVVAAIAMVGALRGLHGATLPSFIPAEESAGPGLLLGLCAGLAEEVLFRVGVLSLVFFALERRAPRPVAGGAAAVISALAFALLHQAGPVPAPAAWFLTRFLIPGLAMSLVALVVSPSAIISAHCAAHLLIPFAFAAPVAS